MGWPQGDGAAVDVDLLAIPLKQLTDGQRLDGKSLVRFDKVHLVQRPAGALQRGGRRSPGRCPSPTGRPRRPLS